MRSRRCCARGGHGGGVGGAIRERLASASEHLKERGVSGTERMKAFSASVWPVKAGIF